MYLFFAFIFTEQAFTNAWNISLDAFVQVSNKHKYLCADILSAFLSASMEKTDTNAFLECICTVYSLRILISAREESCILTRHEGWESSLLRKINSFSIHNENVLRQKKEKMNYTQNQIDFPFYHRSLSLHKITILML